MKNTLILIAFLFSTFIFSQNESVVQAQGGVITKATFSDGGVIHNPPNDLVGTPFLFKKWNNKNYVHLINPSNAKKSVKLSSINVNVKASKFVTKIENDQVFNFNQDYFDYVIINNRRFEFFDDFGTNSKKLAEVIGTIGTNKLIKVYSTFIIRGKVSGYQTSAPKDKIRIKSNFFIYDGNSFKKVKLKKKEILPLFESKKSDKVLKFAKTNKLSFKKVKELSKILNYYNSL